jgi:hypothetical protein
VGYAAAYPLGFADGAVAGAAGSLLAPGFFAAAADFGAGFGGVGAGSGRCELGADDFVHYWDVYLRVEDLRWEFDFVADAFG